MRDTDSKRRNSPVKKSGSSRRFDRDTGRWEKADHNSALLAAMVMALRPQLSKPKITKGKT